MLSVRWVWRPDVEQDVLAPVIWLWSAAAVERCLGYFLHGFSPSAVATAMWMRPLLCMTFETSAKSTLTKSLLTVMISAMPFAADARMSSACGLHRLMTGHRKFPVCCRC